MTTTRAFLSLVLLVPNLGSAVMIPPGQTFFNKAMEVINRELLSRRLGDNETDSLAAPAPAPAPGAGSAENSTSGPAPAPAPAVATAPAGDCITVCEVSKLAGRRRRLENETTATATTNTDTNTTDDAVPGPAPAPAAPPSVSPGPGGGASEGETAEEPGEAGGLALDVLCSVLDCMVEGEGKEICGDMKNMIMGSPDMPAGLYGCVCATEGMSAHMDALMSAGKEGGACADAEKGETGETDLCKLDPTSACAKTMGKVMEKLQTVEACAGMADAMVKDTTPEEMACADEIMAAAMQTTTAAPAPTPPEPTVDLAATQAPAVAALLLLAGQFLPSSCF